MIEPRRLVVVWRVTEACDLNCAFCEFRRGRSFARRAMDAETVLAFGRLLGEWQRATGREVLLSWLGGEPLLWPHFWAVSAELRREHGLSLSVTTNGTRLRNAAVRARLIEDFAEVTISVDGTAEQHDAVRGQPGLHHFVRKMVRDLRDRKRALGRGPVLRVNTILMHSNVRALERLGDELASWGVEELTFNPLGGAPGELFYEAERLQPADVEWVAEHLNEIRLRLARRGLLVRGDHRYLQRLDHGARGSAWPVADCSPGERFWLVDERGRVAPCRFTAAEYGVPVSELRSLDDLIALPSRLAAARRAALATACHDCHSPQVFGKFAREAIV